MGNNNQNQDKTIKAFAYDVFDKIKCGELTQLEVDCKKQAVEQFVNRLNAIPYEVREIMERAAFGGERAYGGFETTEVTPITMGSYVVVNSRYVNDEYDGMKGRIVHDEDDFEIDGDIVTGYGVEFEDAVEYEHGLDFAIIDADDLELDNRDKGLFPMWGTMWQVESFDADNLEAFARAGFRVYENDAFGTFIGIDGAGYNFYEQHWEPLYDNLGFRWHEHEIAHRQEQETLADEHKAFSLKIEDLEAKAERLERELANRPEKIVVREVYTERPLQSPDGVVTSDLAIFGDREMRMAAELMQAYMHNSLDMTEHMNHFEETGVTVAMNRISGTVFLINSEYQTAALNGDGKLDMFFFTPYHGHEGFADELKDSIDSSWHIDDVDYLRSYEVIDDGQVLAWKKTGSIEAEGIVEMFRSGGIDLSEQEISDLYVDDVITDDQEEELSKILENRGKNADKDLAGKSIYRVYEQDSDWYSPAFDTMDEAMAEVEYLEEHNKETEYSIYKTTIKGGRATGQKCVYSGRDDITSDEREKELTEYLERRGKNTHKGHTENSKENSGQDTNQKPTQKPEAERVDKKDQPSR